MPAQQAKPQALDPAFVKDVITQVVKDSIGVDEVPADVPLMDAGMDSLSSLEFRNRLRGAFEGVSMPSSLVFDYPSVGVLTSYIVETSQAAALK